MGQGTETETETQRQTESVAKAKIDSESQRLGKDDSDDWRVIVSHLIRMIVSHLKQRWSQWEEEGEGGEEE